MLTKNVHFFSAVEIENKSSFWNPWNKLLLRYSEHISDVVSCADDVSCGTAIHVTRLGQKEKGRMLGLADRMHVRDVGQDQLVYAVSEALLWSRAELGYSRNVFGSNQAVVYWFWLVQEFDSDGRTNIRWLHTQFLALPVTEKEQQVLSPTVNKPWDPGGTALICLRVLSQHRWKIRRDSDIEEMTTKTEYLHYMFETRHMRRRKEQRETKKAKLSQSWRFKFKSKEDREVSVTCIVDSFFGFLVLTALQTDHEMVKCVKGRQLRS